MYWLGGTPPRNTSVSVPRLTPDRSVRTTTSARPGSGSATGRISPCPGARSQNACASSSTSYASATYGISGATAVKVVKAVRVRVRIGSAARCRGRRRAASAISAVTVPAVAGPCLADRASKLALIEVVHGTARLSASVTEAEALVQRSRADVLLAGSEVGIAGTTVTRVPEGSLHQRAPDPAPSARGNDVDLLEVAVQRLAEQRGLESQDDQPLPLREQRRDRGAFEQTAQVRR